MNDDHFDRDPGPYERDYPPGCWLVSLVAIVIFALALFLIVLDWICQ